MRCSRCDWARAAHLGFRAHPVHLTFEGRHGVEVVEDAADRDNLFALQVVQRVAGLRPQVAPVRPEVTKGLGTLSAAGAWRRYHLLADKPGVQKRQLSIRVSSLGFTVHSLGFKVVANEQPR